jgi:hypothetical protein
MGERRRGSKGRCKHLIHLILSILEKQYNKDISKC